MGNAFNSYNPWIPVLQGQAVGQGLALAEEEGLAHRDRLAAKKAFAQHGSSNYFSGYEGNPQAMRPQAVKDLYASDPEAAIKLEGLLTQDLQGERAIRQAGGIEGAKRAADYQAVTNAFPSFFGNTGEGGMNAFAQEAPPATPTAGEPQASPASMMPQPLTNLSALSGITKKLKIGPTGPEISAEQISPFDRADKEEQRRIEREKFAQSGEIANRSAIQEAHKNVGDVDKEIQSVHKAMQEREIPWKEGANTIEGLKQEKLALESKRDALLGGRLSASSPTPTAPLVPRQGAAMPSAEPMSPVPRGTEPAPMAPQSSAPQFTEKERAASALHDRNEKITAANKEITNARLGVEKVLKFLPQIKELHKIVTTGNIGHPELSAVPGASSALSLSRANAQVIKMNEAIINMFAEPGQSQMMNTIVERQMQGAVVPGIFTEPQLNKINSAILMSNVEHLRELPTFLEKWQKSHGGELTGATEAWIDYTDHNPRYDYKRDARGNVTVKENKNVIEPQTWQYLRENKMVRSVGDKMFVKQKDGSWVEK